MGLKEMLEFLWQRGPFNPCHINIWSNTKRGDYITEGIWVSKGRKVAIR